MKDMKSQKNLLYFILGLVVGALPVVLAWRMQILTIDDFDAEFEVNPEYSYISNHFDSEAKVEFRSYIAKGEHKVLHGPSLLWYPSSKDAEIKIYNHGSLTSVKSRSINLDTEIDKK